MSAVFMMFRRLPAAAFAAAFLALLVVALPARAEVKIQEVVSPGGIRAWLVEDYTVPIVSVRFAFRGGTTQDPKGKEGLANLMTGLFDEGAGELDSDAFQIALDDAGAEMSFSSSPDAIYGSMRMLADRQDEAFGLLKLAVAEPRFDAAPIARIRDQIVTGIEARALDPETRGDIAWAEALYQDHPYARRVEGTKETLASITADDLKGFHERNFARSNLTVGIVGAIDAETLGRRLDEIFGALPQAAQLEPVPPADPKYGQDIRINYNLPQTSLQLAYPGIERHDPQFFAAYLMNQILGGGSFSSRLFKEVREKRGLAYGVGSSLVNRDYAQSLAIGTATRSDRAMETLKVIRDEVKRMVDEGPTEEELAFTKRYVIGAYAINNLDTSSAIARTLVDLQIDNLGIDYIQEREAMIEAVTIDDVRAVAKRLLSAEPAVMIVGPENAGATR